MSSVRHSLGAACLLVPCAANATQSPPSWREAVAAYVAPYVQMNDFSGTILMLRPGKDSLITAFGVADRARGTLNRTDTRYGIGSLTKTFTAAAIAMLTERGKLSLRDTVGKFIPGFPHGREITIEHLLSHTSGVPDYHSLPDYNGMRIHPTTLAQFAAWIGTKPLDFRPGERSAYSSSGYALLAYVIERVADMPYRDFLQRQVFEPLGMRDTGDLASGDPVQDLATGYDPGFPPAGVQPPPKMSATWLEGSGSLYSTASDLATWARALLQNRLFRVHRARLPIRMGEAKLAGARFDRAGRPDNARLRFAHVHLREGLGYHRHSRKHSVSRHRPHADRLGGHHIPRAVPATAPPADRPSASRALEAVCRPLPGWSRIRADGARRP